MTQSWLKRTQIILITGALVWLTFFLLPTYHLHQKHATFHQTMQHVTLKQFDQHGLCSSIIIAQKANEQSKHQQWLFMKPTLNILTNNTLAWVIHSKQALYTLNHNTIELLGPTTIMKKNKQSQTELTIKGTHFIVDLKHHYGQSQNQTKLITQNSTLNAKNIFFSWDTPSTTIKLGRSHGIIKQPPQSTTS
jgi:LPS export ABC transporter protein LptC